MMMVISHEPSWTGIKRILKPLMIIVTLRSHYWVLVSAWVVAAGLLSVKVTLITIFDLHDVCSLTTAACIVVWLWRRGHDPVSVTRLSGCGSSSLPTTAHYLASSACGCWSLGIATFRTVVWERNVVLSLDVVAVYVLVDHLYLDVHTSCRYLLTAVSTYRCWRLIFLLNDHIIWEVEVLVICLNHISSWILKSLCTTTINVLSVARSQLIINASLTLHLPATSMIGSPRHVWVDDAWRWVKVADVGVVIVSVSSVGSWDLLQLPPASCTSRSVIQDWGIGCHLPATVTRVLGTSCGGDWSSCGELAKDVLRSERSIYYCAPSYTWLGLPRCNLFGSYPVDHSIRLEIERCLLLIAYHDVILFVYHWLLLLLCLLNDHAWLINFVNLHEVLVAL